MHDLISRVLRRVTSSHVTFLVVCFGLCMGLSACAPTPVSSLEASILKDPGRYKTRPYRTFVGGTIRDYRIAHYVENWRQHVERVAETNYPKAATEQKIYGNLVATVAVRADGTLESVQVDRTSGFAVLDNAAIDIVKRAAPFEPFTKEMRRDTDILHITRTWTFTRESVLMSVGADQ